MSKRSEKIRLRIELAEQQGWKCIWCNQDTEPMVGYKNTATIEHMIPTSRGGTNKLSNLKSACHRCNSKRVSMDAEQFAEIAKDFLPDSSAYIDGFVGGSMYMKKEDRENRVPIPTKNQNSSQIHIL